MKRLLLLLAVLAALFAFMVMNVRADSCPTLEDYLQANFTVFSDAVLQAAKDMNVEPPIIRLKRSMKLGDTSAMVGGWDEVIDGRHTGVIGIDICQSFLVNPPAVLRHVAAHEICHYKLRNDGADYESEIEAEKCVYYYEGEEVFYKVYSILYAQMEYQMPSLEQLKSVLGVQ